jgi:hypothetical protein
MLTHSPKIVTSGLVFAIDPANAKSYVGSGNTINDMVTAGRTVVLKDNQPTYSTTQAEGLGSLTFDGLNGRGHISNSASFPRIAWTPNASVGNSGITFDFWVKTSDSAGQIISQPWNGSGDYNFYMGPGTFTLGANTNNNLNYATTLATGTWMCGSCWANSTVMGYNINGNQYTGSKAHLITGDTPPTAADINPGVLVMSLYPYSSGWAGLASQAIAGSMGAIKIYNRMLSQDEVLTNFNALRGRYGV